MHVWDVDSNKFLKFIEISRTMRKYQKLHPISRVGTDGIRQFFLILRMA